MRGGSVHGMDQLNQIDLNLSLGMIIIIIIVFFFFFKHVLGLLSEADNFFTTAR